MSKSTPSNGASALPDGDAIATLLDAGKALGQPITYAGTRPAVLVPADYEIKPLPHGELPPLPDHVRQTVTLNDADSFARYVKRYCTTETVIFAQLPTIGGPGVIGPASFRAVFDYHRAVKEGGFPTTPGGTQLTQATRCAHIAEYPCPFSFEWLTWYGIHGKPKPQKDFIDFIDENTPDIAAPPTADLLTLAMNFDSRTEVKFQSKVDRVMGGRQLTFQEDVSTGGTTGNLTVPDMLTLKLPVFEAGQVFELKARLEWLPRDGRLSITVHLRRPEEIVREAFDVLRDEIKTATGIDPWTGTAAAPRGIVS